MGQHTHIGAVVAKSIFTTWCRRRSIMNGGRRRRGDRTGVLATRTPIRPNGPEKSAAPSVNSGPRKNALHVHRGVSI